MTTRWLKRWCLVSLLLPLLAAPQWRSQAVGLQGTAAHPRQTILDKLPSQLRERGAELLAQSDPKMRARLADDLARVDPAATMERPWLPGTS